MPNDENVEPIWNKLKVFILKVMEDRLSELEIDPTSNAMALQFQELYMNGTGKRYNSNDPIDHALFRQYIKWVSNIIPNYINESSIFTDNRNLEVAHGGLEVGENFADGIQTTELLRRILYPYQYPSFSSFRLNIPTMEVGTILNGTQTASYSIANFENVDAVPISIEPNELQYFYNIELNVSYSPQQFGQINVFYSNLLLTEPKNIGLYIRTKNNKGDSFTETDYIRARRYIYIHIGNLDSSPTVSSNIRQQEKIFLDVNDNLTTQKIMPAYTQEFCFYVPKNKNVSVLDLGNLNTDLTDVINYTDVEINHGNGVTTMYKKCTIQLGIIGYPFDTTFKITVN